MFVICEREYREMELQRHSLKKDAAYMATRKHETGVLKVFLSRTQSRKFFLTSRDAKSMWIFKINNKKVAL